MKHTVIISKNPTLPVLAEDDILAEIWNSKPYGVRVKLLGAIADVLGWGNLILA